MSLKKLGMISLTIEYTIQLEILQGIIFLIKEINKFILIMNTRIYDTCLYLFDDIGMDPAYETYQLFCHIRGMLITKEAQAI